MSFRVKIQIKYKGGITTTITPPSSSSQVTPECKLLVSPHTYRGLLDIKLAQCYMSLIIREKMINDIVN